MDYFKIISAVLAIALTAGGIAAWFRRGQGSETIKLLQINIQSYKDAEKLRDQRISYLEGQLLVKDETIKRLLNDTK